jgi:hypothetical protein
MSDGAHLLVTVIGTLCAIIYFNHIVTCIYYFVGQLEWESDTGGRWTHTIVDIMISDSVVEERRYLELSHLYQYMVAFHFFMSQITVGNETVICNNSLERGFNIIGLLCGLLLNTFLISTLSTQLMEYKAMKKGTTQKMRALNQYLIDNNITPGTAFIVQRQARDRLRRRKRLTESDVVVI